MNARPAEEQLRGRVEVDNARLPLRVSRAQAHSLAVSFDDREHVPENGQRFDRFTLTYSGRDLCLGPCVFDLQATASDWDGHLRFLERVYDFRQLFQSGSVQDLGQRVQQLPLVWSRKTRVKPSFRDFASQVAYDLQVYRALFDDVDRNLAEEPPEARAQVQRLAIEAEYGNFCRFFDERLRLLEREVEGYTKAAHEQHGFFFRKQLWDLIMSSEFMARTNLKPRGYAGDSEMMRMIYLREFRGATVFSQFMHRHPIDTTAAEAVRNRRGCLGDAIRSAQRRACEDGRDRVTRVMSVASGPAWELNDVFQEPDDFGRYEFVLLDQDALALAEAHQTVGALELRHGRPMHVRPVRDSVRTILRTSRLSSLWGGKFDLIYSMGLFDYLTRPVAKVVVSRLFELLRPGGELIIGNFHHRNPTRIYMEYWMDWVLYYRTEDELLELAEELPYAERTLRWEGTRSQMFLGLRSA